MRVVKNNVYLSLNSEKKMNYKNWLLNGLILCLVLPCFGAQSADQTGWANHEAPDDLESGQFYNSKTLDMGAMVFGMAFSPNKKLLGIDGLGLSVIDMETGHKIRDFRTKKTMSALAWLHNQPFIVGASGKFNQDIEIVDSLSVLNSQIFKGHRATVNSVAISSDDTILISGSNDATVKIWDILSGKCTHTLDEDGEILSVVMSSDNKTIVSGSNDKTVKIGDIRSGKWERILEGHTGWVKSVAMGSNGPEIVSGSSDKTIKLWDIRLGKCIHTLQGHGEGVNSVARSFDDKTVISGSDDNTVKIWDSVSGKCTHTLEGHDDLIKSVINSDGAIVSGSHDRTVKVWEPKK